MQGVLPMDVDGDKDELKRPRECPTSGARGLHGVPVPRQEEHPRHARVLPRRRRLPRPHAHVMESARAHSYILSKQVQKTR